MGTSWNSLGGWMNKDTQRWILGLIYIVAIAAIWIAASYIVQSVVDAGVSPFLVTYICNSLFMIYIPIAEIGRHLDGSSGYIQLWSKTENNADVQEISRMENVHLLPETGPNSESNTLLNHNGDNNLPQIDSKVKDSERRSSNESIAFTPLSSSVNNEDLNRQVEVKGQWTRTRVAKVSLLICPFWFFAQLAFNLSLKYTTVTSNTILSSTSSLFTFLVSLAFLGEKFSWVKLISVLLCMGGTIIVSLADSESKVDAIATYPLLGDILSLAAAAMYAIYITLIRKKLPDEENGEGRASTAEFLGFLGLFNFLIFLPIAVVLHFTRQEAFDRLNWKQFGLIVGKGLLDNVLSDYLWVKATQLTSTTVATAGLSIQVPFAAVVDSVVGRAPGLLEYLGAAFVMIGFAGINIPSDALYQARAGQQEQGIEDIDMVELGKTSA